MASLTEPLPAVGALVLLDSVAGGQVHAVAVLHRPGGGAGEAVTVLQPPGGMAVGEASHLVVVALHDGALQLVIHPGPPEDAGVVQETDHLARLRVHRQLLDDDVILQRAVAESHPLAHVTQHPAGKILY